MKKKKKEEQAKFCKKVDSVDSDEYWLDFVLQIYIYIFFPCPYFMANGEFRVMKGMEQGTPNELCGANVTDVFWNR